MKLRSYQVEAVENLRTMVASGRRRPVLVMPTGSGKTIVAAELIRRATAKGRPSLFLAPRRELVYQTSAKLEAMGVMHGIMMAGEKPSSIPLVQVASTSTLYRRCFQDRAPVDPPRADLIVVDEAHANMSTMAQTILGHYPSASIVGFTATPARADGRGLGEIYDGLVMGPTVSQLTAEGYLVPMRYYAPTKVDLTGVKVQMGDYHQGQLAERMSQPKLIGDVLENWSRIAPDRLTVVFAVNRAHAMALNVEFSRWGIPADYIDGNTPHEERREILHRISTGQSKVLCSVDVLSYGWDCPPVSCAIIARPTKSIARYLQAAGRVLRPYEGKTDCILIDHTGAIEEHGFVDDPQPWSLDGNERVQDRREAQERTDPEPMNCPHCQVLIRPAPSCPVCGAQLKVQYAKAIKTHQAYLEEVRVYQARARRAKGVNHWTAEERAEFFRELRGYAELKGYKDGWAAHQYRKRFDKWPRGLPSSGSVGDHISEETLNWIRGQQIRFIKSRERERERNGNELEFPHRGAVANDTH